MEFKIANKNIGDEEPVFFIAEAGVNHNGSIDLGKQLIDVAVESGADAVKFQTFKAEELNTKFAPKSTYHIETTGNDAKQSWYDLLKTQEISDKMHIDLIEYCNKKNIIFLSTPYGEESADLLESLNVPAYKIASTDTNNLPLLKHIANKGKPMIISTAMCTMDEVTEAYDAIRATGINEIGILQCTGNYPSKISDSNLNIIKTYMEMFNCVIGYSDHTKEFINPIAATSIGAKIYEKHFTIDKNLPGPDHRMSLEPNGLKRTIELIRNTEYSLGQKEKVVLEDEKENRLKLRKSLVTLKPIKKNMKIEKKHISIKRPGTGISPSKLETIIGMTAIKDLDSDHVISLEDVK